MQNKDPFSFSATAVQDRSGGADNPANPSYFHLVTDEKIQERRWLSLSQAIFN